MPSRPLDSNEIEIFKTELLKTGKYAKRNLMYFYLGIYSGFRVNELLSIKIKNVMTYPPNINKKLFLSAGVMKGKKDSRTVIINPILRKAIEEYLEEFDELYSKHERIVVNITKSDPECPLFPSRNSELDPKTGLRKPKRLMNRQMSEIINSIATKLKLENVSTHSLRKTYAKSLYEIFDKDIIKLQKGLNHKDIT